MGKLRTAQSKSVADAAKEIVKQWKTEVDRAKGFPGVLPSLFALNTILNFGKSKKQHQHRLPLLDLRLNPIPLPLIALQRLMVLEVGQEMPHAISVSSSCMMRSWATPHLVRSTPSPFCRSFKLTHFWLATERVLSISRAVEKSVLELMGGTTAEYKSKIRSLFVNLKDKANPALRASLVDGSLAPEKFARMTSQVRFLFFFSISFSKLWTCYRKWLLRRDKPKIRK